MTIREVYERYAHLDDMLCDPRLGEGFTYDILRDLWLAVKESVEKEQAK